MIELKNLEHLNYPQFSACLIVFQAKITIGVPDEIRTRVAAVKGRCPRPLDDGDIEIFLIY